MRLRPCIFGCWLVLLVLPAGLVHAQRVEAYIDADSVTVGERFTLSLVATHDALASPSFPVPALDDSLFGDLEVIREVTHEQRELGEGMQVDSVVYEVATFALDTAFVPGLPVHFSADADTFTVASSPVFIPVRSLVPPDAEGLQDLAPLADFPRPLWPWVLIGLAVLVLAAMLWYYLRRRAARPEPQAPAPAQPPVPAYEEAMRRLRALERVDLYDEAAVKPFYVELSDLLRTYLERTLRVAALEMTTREVVGRLRSPSAGARVPGEVVSRVKWVLDLADLAKFADVHPEPEQGLQAIGEVHTVLQTIEDAVHEPPRPQREAVPAGTGAPSPPPTNGQA